MTTQETAQRLSTLLGSIHGESDFAVRAAIIRIDRALLIPQRAHDLPAELVSVVGHLAAANEKRRIDLLEIIASLHAMTEDQRNATCVTCGTERMEGTSPMLSGRRTSADGK